MDFLKLKFNGNSSTIEGGRENKNTKNLYIRDFCGEIKSGIETLCMVNLQFDGKSPFDAGVISSYMSMSNLVQQKDFRIS